MGTRYYSKRLRRAIEKKMGARGNTSRPKSFKTEEAARKWAGANKIKDYTLKNLKNSESQRKKIVIVQK